MGGGGTLDECYNRILLLINETIREKEIVISQGKL